MRFQVPQFVDIEDRIIGPLTLKMFAYYAVAGMILVPFYVLLDISLFITVALPILGLAALFAHVRIYGQTFVYVLIHAVTYYVNPRVYLWRRSGAPSLLKIRGAEFETEALEEAEIASLNAIAQMLNTQGNVSSKDATDPLATEEEAEEALAEDQETPANGTAKNPADQRGAP